LFLRWFKWSGVTYLAVLCLLYLVDALNVYRAGGGVLGSIGWVFFPEYREGFVDSLIDFSFSWWIAVVVLFGFAFLLFDDLERLNNLGEKIRRSEERLSSLKGEMGRLKGELQRLEEKKKSLETDIGYLEHKKTVVWNDLEELKERKGNLSLYIEKMFRKAYEEGREKGYKSVITELRSLRAQKSALVDLFNRERELQKVFRRVAGKKLLQFLNEVKKGGVSYRREEG